MGRGQFREDLFYRLNVFAIHLPPLRDRKDDVLPLSDAFLAEYGRSLGRPPAGISRDARARLLEYHWPGNLRELRNFVIRTLILRDQESAYAYLRSKTQTPSNVATASVTGDAGNRKTANLSGMKDAISEIKNQTEIRMLQDALSASNWNRRRAAMNLNISYRSLLYKIQQHGLSA